MIRRPSGFPRACLSLVVLACAAGFLSIAPAIGAGAPAAPAQAKPAMDKPAAEAAIPNNGRPMSPATAAAFDRMKSLLGEWQGTTPEGHPVKLSYRLISGGTCIQETETMEGHEGGDMVSIYCPDGDGLLMTHYCAANNQPRMRATKLSGDRNILSFAFVDASNLASDKAGHMHALQLTFEDSEHFTQAWTYRNNGQDDTEKFALTRKNG